MQVRRRRDRTAPARHLPDLDGRNVVPRAQPPLARAILHADERDRQLRERLVHAAAAPVVLRHGRRDQPRRAGLRLHRGRRCLRRLPAVLRDQHAVQRQPGLLLLGRQLDAYARRANQDLRRHLDGGLVRGVGLCARRGTLARPSALVGAVYGDVRLPMGRHERRVPVLRRRAG